MPYMAVHSSPYDAETVQLMSEAFDEVCTELGLARPAPLRLSPERTKPSEGVLLAIGHSKVYITAITDSEPQASVTERPFVLPPLWQGSTLWRTPIAFLIHCP